MDAETQKRLDSMVVREQELKLEDAEEAYTVRQQRKASDRAKNEARQKQLAADVETRRRTIRRCLHRQGGSAKNPLRGKGPTALNVATMPDGFTKVIMCQLCRLRVFNPHPMDGAKKQREGETKEAAAKRVRAFKEAEERFEKYYEMSRDGITEESVQEMECGVTISVKDGEGLPVYPRRPCDTENYQAYA